MRAFVVYTGHESEGPDLAVTSTNDVMAIKLSNDKKCFFCGRTYLRRSICPTREVAC